MSRWLFDAKVANLMLIKEAIPQKSVTSKQEPKDISEGDEVIHISDGRSQVVTGLP